MRTLFLMMLIGALGVVGWVTYAQYFPEHITIQDPVLKRCILNHLEREKGEITAREARGIVELNCRQSALDYSNEREQIESLGGIEQLSALRVLTLRDHKITDIKPLLQLKHLKRLKLAGNPLKRGDVAILKKRGVRFSGFLSKKAVRDVIRKQKGEMQRCYEDALTQNPQLGGRIVLSFYVNGAGGVEEVAVKKSSLNDRKMEQCMVDVMQKARFPESFGKRFKVNYPFTFSSGEDQKVNTSTGSVTRKRVKLPAPHDIIRSKKAAITRCYQRALKENKDLEGRIKLSFYITAEGGR